MVYTTMNMPIVDFADLLCAYKEEYGTIDLDRDEFAALIEEEVSLFYPNTNPEDPYTTDTSVKLSIVLHEYFHIPTTCRLIGIYTVGRDWRRVLHEE